MITFKFLYKLILKINKIKIYTMVCLFFYNNGGNFGFCNEWMKLDCISKIQKQKLKQKLMSQANVETKKKAIYTANK